MLEIQVDPELKQNILQQNSSTGLCEVSALHALWRSSRNTTAASKLTAKQAGNMLMLGSHKMPELLTIFSELAIYYGHFVIKTVRHVIRVTEEQFKITFWAC